MHGLPLAHVRISWLLESSFILQGQPMGVSPQLTPNAGNVGVQAACPEGEQRIGGPAVGLRPDSGGRLRVPAGAPEGG